jgi:hypothetical protein
MNYDQVNKLSDYILDEVIPLLHITHSYTGFGEYVDSFRRTKSGRWMKKYSIIPLFPATYCVNTVEFLTRFNKQMVCFYGNERPEDGMLGLIFQFTPTLHMNGKLYIWFEHEKVNSYIAPQILFDDIKEYLKFVNDNKDLKMLGNTQDRDLGFQKLSV